MRTNPENPLLAGGLLGALSYCEMANALIESERVQASHTLVSSRKGLPYSATEKSKISGARLELGESSLVPFSEQIVRNQREQSHIRIPPINYS